ncbi:MAG: glycosyltransferase [Polaribacter sp.]|jgi:glycosyltransferase involved in cell wall biosynthesis|uniref:glycosyltransferase n=1 Tax=Polaribacter sp. TaxID=1920175 RepID=UPI00384B3C8E
MKKGIVIVFSEDEDRIHKDEIINLSNQKDIKVCLVNNGSKDSTLQVLKSVKDDLESNCIFIIDIKKNTAINTAAKAGARFLFSAGDLKYIVYLSSNILGFFKIKQFEVLKKIEKEFVGTFVKTNNRRNIKKFYSPKDFYAFR